MKKFNAFAPMTEHINYFTPKAIELLLTNNGFEVIANEVHDIDMLWRKTKTLSVMAKIKSNIFEKETFGYFDIAKRGLT